MSEYQYYEFQAIDRRLTGDQMAELRAYSSRARITSTSFVNEYEWGNFKGDEDAWIGQYFDAFLYFANWGTRILKLGLPASLLDRKTADLYCNGESAWARERNGKMIITLGSEEEDGDEWPDNTGALSALIPIRTELSRGDLRSLYLGWLLCAQGGELEDDEVEPPVPSGLGELSGSLERLVDFLRIDKDLLDVAAAASPVVAERTVTPEEIREWLAGVSQADKDDYLARFIAADEAALAPALQRLIEDRKGRAAVSGTRRTAGALLRAAGQVADDRRHAEAEKAAKEKARLEREAAMVRSKYLAQLAQREPAAWDEIDRLIATRQPSSYDRAVALLVDLRETAAAQGRQPSFLSRLEALEKENRRKPSLISKIRGAGLPSL